MHKKKKRENAFSLKSTIFALLMYKHLISEQRYAIYLMLQKNMSKKEIAASIGVSPSTITRERNAKVAAMVNTTGLPLRRMLNIIKEGNRGTMPSRTI